MRRRIVIATDLDGTLLDSRTYSFEAAMSALEQVRVRRIPLIIVSSKTRAEIEIYRSRLRNTDPFISENGGGIFIPDGCLPYDVSGEHLEGYTVRALGMPYERSRALLVRLRNESGIAVRGFGDMTPDEVSAVTGLVRREALLAKQRDFSEPFVFPGEPDERFLRAIETAGARWTQGRLFHIMGDHDKGKAVTLLRELWERAYGRVKLVGLGDGLNDLPFLRVVDRPVLVKGEYGHDPRIDIPGLLRTSGSGPAGWNEAVLAILEDK
jgi:mannosyl-3-phosphoglycerate phosphatase family protein